MDTPHQVIQAADWLIQQFGSHFELLGEYKGQDAYLFITPEGLKIGFPYVYLFKDGDDSALEVTGLEALDIISSLGAE